MPGPPPSPTPYATWRASDTANYPRQRPTSPASPDDSRFVELPPVPAPAAAEARYTPLQQHRQASTTAGSHNLTQPAFTTPRGQQASGSVAGSVAGTAAPASTIQRGGSVLSARSMSSHGGAGSVAASVAASTAPPPAVGAVAQVSRAYAASVGSMSSAAPAQRVGSVASAAGSRVGGGDVADAASVRSARSSPRVTPVRYRQTPSTTTNATAASAAGTATPTATPRSSFVSGGGGAAAGAAAAGRISPSQTRYEAPFPPPAPAGVARRPPSVPTTPRNGVLGGGSGGGSFAQQPQGTRDANTAAGAGGSASIYPLQQQRRDVVPLVLPGGATPRAVATPTPTPTPTFSRTPPSPFNGRQPTGVAVGAGPGGGAFVMETIQSISGGMEMVTSPHRLRAGVPLVSVPRAASAMAAGLPPLMPLPSTPPMEVGAGLAARAAYAAALAAQPSLSPSDLTDVDDRASARYTVAGSPRHASPPAAVASWDNPNPGLAAVQLAAVYATQPQTPEAATATALAAAAGRISPQPYLSAANAAATVAAAASAAMPSPAAAAAAAGVGLVSPQGIVPRTTSPLRIRPPPQSPVPPVPGDGDGDGGDAAGGGEELAHPTANANALDALRSTSAASLHPSVASILRRNSALLEPVAAAVSATTAGDTTVHGTTPRASFSTHVSSVAGAVVPRHGNEAGCSVEQRLSKLEDTQLITTLKLEALERKFLRHRASYRGLALRVMAKEGGRGVLQAAYTLWAQFHLRRKALLTLASDNSTLFAARYYRRWREHAQVKTRAKAVCHHLLRETEGFLRQRTWRALQKFTAHKKRQRVAVAINDQFGLRCKAIVLRRYYQRLLTLRLERQKARRRMVAIDMLGGRSKKGTLRWYFDKLSRFVGETKRARRRSRVLAGLSSRCPTVLLRRYYTALAAYTVENRRAKERARRESALERKIAELANAAAQETSASQVFTDSFGEHQMMVAKRLGAIESMMAGMRTQYGTLEKQQGRHSKHVAALERDLSTLLDGDSEQGLAAHLSDLRGRCDKAAARIAALEAAAKDGGATAASATRKYSQNVGELKAVLGELAKRVDSIADRQGAFARRVGEVEGAVEDTMTRQMASDAAAEAARRRAGGANGSTNGINDLSAAAAKELKDGINGDLEKIRARLAGVERAVAADTKELLARLTATERTLATRCTDLDERLQARGAWEAEMQRTLTVQGHALEERKTAGEKLGKQQQETANALGDLTRFYQTLKEETNTALRGVNQKQAGVAQSLSDLNREYQDVDSELQAMRGQVKSITASMGDLAQSCAALEGDVRGVGGQQKATAAALEGTTSELKALQQQVKAAGQTLTELNQGQHNTVNEVRNLGLQLKGVAGRVDGVEGDIKNVAANGKGTAKDLHELRDRIDDLESEMRRGLRRSLEGGSGFGAEAAAALAHDVEQLKAKADALDDALAAVNGRCRTMDDKYTALATQQKEAAKKTTETVKAAAAAEAKQGDNDREIRSALARLTDSIEQVRGDLEHVGGELQRQVPPLAASVRTMGTEQQQLRGAFEDETERARADHGRLRADVQQLKAVVDAEKQAQQALKASLEPLQTEHGRMKHDVANLKSTVSADQVRLEQLELDVRETRERLAAGIASFARQCAEAAAAPSAPPTPPTTSLAPPPVDPQVLGQLQKLARDVEAARVKGDGVAADVAAVRQDAADRQRVVEEALKDLHNKVNATAAAAGDTAGVQADRDARDKERTRALESLRDAFEEYAAKLTRLTQQHDALAAGTVEAHEELKEKLRRADAARQQDADDLHAHIKQAAADMQRGAEAHTDRACAGVKDALSTRVDAVERACATLPDRVDAQCAATREHVQGKLDDAARAQQRLAERVDSLEIDTTKLKPLPAKVDALSEEVERLANSGVAANILKQLPAQVNALADDLDRLNNVVKQLPPRVDGVCDEVDRVNAAVAALSKQLPQGRLDEVDQAIDAMRASLAKQAQSQLPQRMEELDSQIAALRGKAQTADDVERAAAAVKAALVPRVDALEAGVQQLQQAPSAHILADGIRGIEAQLADAKRAVERVASDQAARAASSTPQSTQGHGDSSGAVAALSNRLRDVEDQQGRVHGRLQEMEETCTRVPRQLKTLEDEAHDLHAQLHGMNARLTDVEAVAQQVVGNGVGSIRGRLDDLEAHADGAQRDAQQVGVRVERVEREQQHQADHLQQLQQQVQRGLVQGQQQGVPGVAAADAAALDAAVKQLVSRVEALEAHAAKLPLQLGDLRHDVSMKQNDLAAHLHQAAQTATDAARVCDALAPRVEDVEAVTQLLKKEIVARLEGIEASSNQQQQQQAPPPQLVFDDRVPLRLGAIEAQLHGLACENLPDRVARLEKRGEERAGATDAALQDIDERLNDLEAVRAVPLPSPAASHAMVPPVVVAAAPPVPPAPVAVPVEVPVPVPVPVPTPAPVPPTPAQPRGVSPTRHNSSGMWEDSAAAVNAAAAGAAAAAAVAAPPGSGDTLQALRDRQRMRALAFESVLRPEHRSILG